VQANHAQTLKAMDDREEALAVVGAAAEGRHGDPLKCRLRASRLRQLVRDRWRGRDGARRIGPNWDGPSMASNSPKNRGPPLMGGRQKIRVSLEVLFCSTAFFPLGKSDSRVLWLCV